MTHPTERQMMLEQLGKAFKCPKCHGDQGHARRVRLPTAKISSIFNREPGEFAFVSCGLCGYTEIYDLAAYAKLCAKDPQRVSATPSAASTEGA